MWSWLRSITQRQSTAGTAQAYRAYTTEFDRVIFSNEIDRFLGTEGAKAFIEYAVEFDRAVSAWHAKAEVAAIEAVAQLRAADLAPFTSETIASLLIDHSGSMRDQRAILSVATIEIVARIWDRVGLSYEILGFTTQSWHGGQSRKKWMANGCPNKPGRLCDLLHIVYRSFDDSIPGAPWSIRNVARRELLKENVDGEAIAWATDRLRNRPEPKKMLVVVSDGAPVDDSTLLANDIGYLERHLTQQIAKISETRDIQLSAIGIDYMPSFYPRDVVVTIPDDIATRVVPFVADITRAAMTTAHRRLVDIEPAVRAD